MSKDTNAVTKSGTTDRVGSIARKPLSALTLLDRFLFDTAMEDQSISHTVFSIILGRELPPIRYGITEKHTEAYYDSRAVRMDLMAFDADDVVYDAEAQQRNRGLRNLSRRSRFYQAQIDVNLLEPGEEGFENLNDAYVIFISPFDLFGQGKYMYTFRMRCEEDHDLVLQDGQVHIYLNTHGTNEDEVSGELVELLHYMEHTTQKNREIKSERIRKLSRQIEKIKTDQKVGIKYMRFRDEFLIERMEIRAEAREEGLAEGRAEGRAEGLTEGRAEGRAEGRMEGQELQAITVICKKLAKHKTIEEIADAIEGEVSFVQEISDIAEGFAPDYEADKIYAAYAERHKHNHETD